MTAAASIMPKQIVASPVCRHVVALGMPSPLLMGMVYGNTLPGDTSGILDKYANPGSKRRHG